MSNRIGLTLLPETPDIDAALDLGCSVYLLIHAPETPAVVDRILERQPDARILIRRYGGVDSGRVIAEQLWEWFPQYLRRGVVDLVPFNEADRVAEGGWPYETIAARFVELERAFRDLFPSGRLHWPALSEEAGYAEIGKWKGAAALADCLGGHWYRDADGIDALGRFFESHFPGVEWFVTEYSSRGLNAPPPRLGVGQDAYEACRKAHLWPLCRGVLFFAWAWPGAEPGGQVEEIKDDPETLAALHRAVGDFREAPAPQPEPEASPMTDWSRYQRDWLDDGDDCISSSFHEALRLTYGDGVPDVDAIEAAYYRWHPDWDNHASTMRLDWYWEALASIGIRVESLPERGDLIDQIGAELAQNRYPTAWIYLWDAVSRTYFHHAVVVVGYRDGELVLWDQQRGIGWAVSLETFLHGTDSVSSGHAYAAYWQPAEPAPAPTAPEVTMEPIRKSIMAWQLDHTREKTVREWVDTLRLGGIDCFRVKSHHAQNWMGNVYSHPLAPTGLDEIERQYEAFGAEGICYLPWCVPMGLNVAAEAALAIGVAKRCGNRIDIDLEVGPEFWDTKRLGNRGIVDYFARLKDAGLYVLCDTAMFEGWVEALALVEIAPYVDRILSQSYDLGFSQLRGHTVDYHALFDHDVAEMKRTGIGEYGIILDARAGTGITERAAYAQSLGAVEVSCWAGDFAEVRTYKGFAAVPTRPYLEEAAPVDQDAIYRAIMHEAEAISDLADVIGHNATPGSEGGDTSITDAQAVAAIREAADGIDRARLRVVDLAGQVRV